MKKTVIIILLTFHMTIAADVSALKQINLDVWYKFYQAFDHLDADIMARIHSQDVIRIPAQRNDILDYDTYMANYKAQFESAKENGTTLNISLRFFERIIKNDLASERGVFRFTVNKGTNNEGVYYGQFHVLLKQIDGAWKITMDYDSNENETISVENYNRAFAIDALHKYK